MANIIKSANVQMSNVNHPSHYNSGKIEVIDFIEDQNLDFKLGNVVKYICRHKGKNGLEDLEKAKWYLDRAIQRMEKDAELLAQNNKPISQVQTEMVNKLIGFR